MSMFFTFLGGLGLLLFGMAQMSEGLRKAAGKKARRILELLTSNVATSVGVGALVTCIIQSSSATTVMVVGFVNAGLMGLKQAIGTIMGANIGTTITAWLIAMFAFLKEAKISKYGLPMVGIGFIAHAANRPRGSRHWGQVLLGLGLIILGLGHMTGGFKPLTQQKGDSKLIVREVVDWPRLCHRLNVERVEAAENPSKRVWEALPKDAQSALQEASLGGAIDKRTKTKIVDGLNQCLARRDLYDAAAFKVAMVDLADDAKELVRRSPEALADEEVVRLNRRLLEASFPEIAVSRGMIQKVFARFAEIPLLGFLVGALVTAIIQSSSATIGIIQILAASGVVSLEAALPLVLGTNVGTCITAYIASIGTNANARRAARAHLLFNMFGVVYLFVLGLLAWLVKAAVPGDLTLGNIAVHIAVAHTTVNVLSTLIFMPFIGHLESWVVRWVPGDGDEMMGKPQFLEKHLLDAPVLALDCAKKEILRMMEIASDALADAMAGLMEGKTKAIKRVARREDAIDQLQSEITDYLVEISSHGVDLSEASEFPTLIHVVNDIERIGDHAINIAELAQTCHEGKLAFSKAGARDIRKLKKQVDAMMAESIMALQNNDAELARTAYLHEEAISAMEVDCRKSHASRLTKKKCNATVGLIFLDVVANLEKVGDHLANVNQAVMGAFHWGEKVEPEDVAEPAVADADDDGAS